MRVSPVSRRSSPYSIFGVLRAPRYRIRFSRRESTGGRLGRGLDLFEPVVLYRDIVFWVVRVVQLNSSASSRVVAPASAFDIMESCCRRWIKYGVDIGRDLARVLRKQTIRLAL
jgi:hypothetical protein